MKKVFLSAFTFCLLSSAAVFAQEVGQEQPATTQETIDQEQPAADVSSAMKTEVEIQELPEAVLNTLSGEEYQEWTPTASYKVVDEAENELYSVELQKEEETQELMFDAQGNKVESEETEEVEGTEGTQEMEGTEGTELNEEGTEGTEIIEEGTQEEESSEVETEELN